MPSLTGFTPLLIAVVVLAVVFDFINGFHDTANAVATVISTRVLRPWIAIALLLMRLLVALFGHMPPGRVGGIFRHTQVLSAAFMAFSHGSNDAQKTMGVITLGLLGAHLIPTFHVPVWVIVLSALTMAAGTFAGGKRIIHTMGTRFARLDPIHG